MHVITLYGRQITVYILQQHCLYCSYDSSTLLKNIKNSSTALFTHLKIILLQYFQFQFSVSTKISSIQTHPWSFMNSIFVHCLWVHKFHFSVTFSLKMGLTVLFTHLKIILLQCFQFQQNKFYPDPYLPDHYDRRKQINRNRLHVENML